MYHSLVLSACATKYHVHYICRKSSIFKLVRCQYTLQVTIIEASA